MRILFVLSFLFAAGSSQAGDTYVKGYVKKDGTYVSPHYRSEADGTKNNNYSTKGNVNPYTGKEGTKEPDSSYAPSSDGSGD